MSYDELINRLKSLKDEKYIEFHSSLIKNNNVKLLGVRIPILRKIAREYKGKEKLLLSFPSIYFDVKFIKLVAISYLPYNEFILYSDECVDLIDNWALNDSFIPLCIKDNREDYLLYLEKYIGIDKEFYQRFAITTLMKFYLDEKYYDVIIKFLRKANNEYYYVNMASAWLIAEILVNHEDFGLSILKDDSIPLKTRLKAIQKANESFRVKKEIKLKINKIKNIIK